MRLKVQIEGHVFEVEVDDLDARPIVATVDGERFEVWPDVVEAHVGAAGSAPIPAPVGAQGGAPVPGTASSPTPVSLSRPEGVGAGDKARWVRAPIPGVIVAIAVRPGAKVQIGDELCVLEAMKMKNVIRATRAGQIAEVHVTVGQQVKHQELLVEYAP